MKSTIFRCIVIASLLSSGISLASEVDSFTGRYQPLTDVSDYINQKTEEYFDQALAQANKRSGCSEKRLFKSLRKQFRNHVQGQFNRWMAHTHEFSKRPTVYSNSVYRDFKWHDAFTIAIKNIYKDTAADLINLNGHLIGTDKFEHFFGRGWAYYQKTYVQNKGVLASLKFGHNSERIFLGAQTTGIYSYGDLAANFMGMRFWNHILQKHDDVLGKKYNYGPYVVCQDNKWVKNKQERSSVIDWKKYVSAAWDEGNNCSKFRNKSLLNKVLSRIEKLEQASPDQRFKCPINPELIQQSFDDMAPYSEWFINPWGHAAL